MMTMPSLSCSVLWGECAGMPEKGARDESRAGGGKRGSERRDTLAFYLFCMLRYGLKEQEYEEGEEEQRG